MFISKNKYNILYLLLRNKLRKLDIASEIKK